MQANSEQTNESKISQAATMPPAGAEIAPEYNGIDRNAWLFGWTPQQEIWNGRLAMIGFVAYLLWDKAGYSVLRDVLHLIR